MKMWLLSLATSAALVLTANASAKDAASGLCADGSTTHAKTEKGACSKHGGVKTWYAASQSTQPAAAPSVPAAAPATAPAARHASSAVSMAGASAICSDGSYSHAKTEARACTKHGGVKTWMGASSSAPPMSAPAPAPGTAPTARPAPSAASIANATALCADGSYSHVTVKMLACSSHGGIKTWFGKNSPTPTAPTGTSAPPMSAPAPRTSPTQPAAGAGPGMVWVNLRSKIYHCSNDKWYGRTKRGLYLSEANAKAKGYRAEHGKECQ